jgi:hypothetical protein
MGIWRYSATVLDLKTRRSASIYICTYLCMFIFCGIFAPWGNCWNTETSKHAHNSSGQCFLCAKPHPALCMARQRCKRMTSTTVQNAAFFRMLDSGFIGETEVSSQSVRRVIEVSSQLVLGGDSHGRFVVEGPERCMCNLCEQSSVEWEWIIAAVRNPQFKVSYQHKLWREDLRAIFGVWEYYSFWAGIRCWETTSGDWES